MHSSHNNDTLSRNQKHYLCEFDLRVVRARIAFKFPCSLFLSWKAGNQTCENRQQKKPVNNTVEFDTTLSLTVPMVYGLDRNIFLEKKSILSLYFVSATKSESDPGLAGILPIYLHKCLNSTEPNNETVYSLQRCPDKNSQITISIKGTRLQEIEAGNSGELSARLNRSENSKSSSSVPKLVGLSSIGEKSAQHSKTQRESAVDTPKALNNHSHLAALAKKSTSALEQIDVIGSGKVSPTFRNGSEPTEIPRIPQARPSSIQTRFANMDFRITESIKSNPSSSLNGESQVVSRIGFNDQAASSKQKEDQIEIGSSLTTSKISSIKMRFNNRDSSGSQDINDHRKLYSIEENSSSIIRKELDSKNLSVINSKISSPDSATQHDSPLTRLRQENNQQEIGILKEKLRQQQKQILSATRENQILKENLENMKFANQVSMRRLADTYNGTLQQLKSSTVSLTQLQQQKAVNAQLVNRIQQLQRVATTEKDLRATLHQTVQQKQLQLKQLKAAITQLEARVEKLQLDNGNLRQESESKNLQISQQIEQLNIQKLFLEQQREFVVQLKEQIETLKLANENADKTAQLSLLQNALVVQKELNAKLMVDMEELHKKEEATCESLQRLQTTVKEYQSLELILRDNLESLEFSFNKAFERIAENDQEQEILRSQISHAKKELLAKSKRCEQLQTQLESLRQQTDKLRIENDCLRSDLVSMEEKYEDTAEKLNSLEERQYEQYVNKLNTLVQQLRVENSTLKENKSEATSKNQQLTQRITELEAELATLNEQFYAKFSDQNQMELRLEENEQKIKNLQGYITKIQEQLSTKATTTTGALEMLEVDNNHKPGLANQKPRVDLAEGSDFILQEADGVEAKRILELEELVGHLVKRNRELTTYFESISTEKLMIQNALLELSTQLQRTKAKSLSTANTLEQKKQVLTSLKPFQTKIDELISMSRKLSSESPMQDELQSPQSKDEFLGSDLGDSRGRSPSSSR